MNFYDKEKKSYGNYITYIAMKMKFSLKTFFQSKRKYQNSTISRK